MTKLDVARPNMEFPDERVDMAAAFRWMDERRAPA